jgi:hypothetical protein
MPHLRYERGSPGKNVHPGDCILYPDPKKEICRTLKKICPEQGEEIEPVRKNASNGQVSLFHEIISGRGNLCGNNSAALNNQSNPHQVTGFF